MNVLATREPESRLLSGNEAAARGAWEAGATVAAGYPGTPSTKILEAFARFPGTHAEWAPNEKVAADVAIGASYAGSRAVAVMKHVGPNVAADSLMYASMTGAEAGMVIITADDPAMHSSQNESAYQRNTPVTFNSAVSLPRIWRPPCSCSPLIHLQ